MPWRQLEGWQPSFIISLVTVRWLIYVTKLIGISFRQWLGSYLVLRPANIPWSILSVIITIHRGDDNSLPARKVKILLAILYVILLSGRYPTYYIPHYYIPYLHGWQNSEPSEDVLFLSQCVTCIKGHVQLLRWSQLAWGPIQVRHPFKNVFYTYQFCWWPWYRSIIILLFAIIAQPCSWTPFY